MEKKMKVQILILFIYISLFHIAFSNDTKRFDTRIEINTDKLEYYVYEPIVLSYHLSNNCEFGPSIGPSDIEENLTIQNEFGHIFPSTSRSYYQDKYRLQLGEQYNCCFNLLENYGPENGNFSFSCRCLLPGEYSVQFIWKEDGYAELKSNEIGIVITNPPVSDEGALQLFHKGMAKLDEHEVDTSICLFDSLINNYPESMYVPMAMKEYMLLNFATKVRKSDHQKAMLMAKRMLEKHGNHYYIGVANFVIRKYYKKCRDKQSIKKYYKELRNRTNKKKLKGIIDVILTQLELEEE